jgi:hypothetical protein
MATTVNNLDVAVYFANAALGMSWPTSWTPVGSAHITSLAGYAETVVAIPWSTPNTTGHFCMLARVNALEDPISIGPDTLTPADLPQNNNNITMRNMEIVRFPEITHCAQITTGLYTDVVTLDVVNTTGEPVLVDILLESDDYPLDTGELLLSPGDLWGNWEALTNFEQLGMDLVVTGFPASIQGIALIPYQRTPVTITMTAEVGIRFTLRVSEAVESQVVGGVTYVREVPHCVYLPLVMRSSPPGASSALERLWDGWAGWRNYHNGFRWLEVLHRAGYYPQFKPGS